MKKLIMIFAAFLFFSPIAAKVVTQTVEYKDADTTLEGYLAYDDSVQGKRPGILVVHEWNGLGHYVQGRCEQLAELGYVAFAPDIYGKGVRPSTFDACKAESAKYYANRKLLRERANAGLTQLKKNEMVDTSKVAAIGYCFGGATVLELGRSGADIEGIVTFHGGLDNPNPADARNIKAKVLICQGGADKFTLPAVPGFKKEMDDAKVDYKLVVYDGAVHGFTNPDNKGTVPGLKYDAKADKASWNEMKRFLKRFSNRSRNDCFEARDPAGFRAFFIFGGVPSRKEERFQRAVPRPFRLVPKPNGEACSGRSQREQAQFPARSPFEIPGKPGAFRRGGREKPQADLMMGDLMADFQGGPASGSYF